MRIETTSDVVAFLLAEAEAAYPHECCGLLLGEGGRILSAQPTANVAPDPARHFEIAPVALIAAHKAARAGGAEVLGYYHSHPTGRYEPSATDKAQAAADGRIWAIVAGGTIGWWRDSPDGFAPVDICQT
ncbi:Mov34/MPN/PAD-1 family protein [Croceicoccus naphthovorans]|uniref:Peptidase n=1 Tax=Croceicoccus naphthovorans TaxID=1348774 RepID=A0A0G3XJN5_9SPHN|nr:M67 family metallopeptidase [Croceicoccus naphthovorans]AKM10831.1 peptidase [Croceicoccus naphthovorans]MBB3989047.1 proteasome lid subunit RPN8/RPN11 [Croceicoccus naphthovorans]